MKTVNRKFIINGLQERAGVLLRRAAYAKGISSAERCRLCATAYRALGRAAELDGSVIRVVEFLEIACSYDRQREKYELVTA